MLERLPPSLLFLEVTAQTFAQLGAGPKQNALHCRHRKIENLRNLLVTHLFVAAKNQRHPLAFRKLHDRVFDRLAQFVPPPPGAPAAVKQVIAAGNAMVVNAHPSGAKSAAMAACWGSAISDDAITPNACGNVVVRLW